MNTIPYAINTLNIIFILLFLQACVKNEPTVNNKIISPSTPVRGAYYGCIVDGCAGEKCVKNVEAICNAFPCRAVINCNKMSNTTKGEADELAKSFTNKLKEEKLINNDYEYQKAFEFTKALIISNK